MAIEKEFIAQLNTHQNIIHKICNVYMSDEAAREDLFQEITLQAWKGYKAFKNESKFSTWLYRVALNTAISFYRKEKNKLNIVSPEEISEKVEVADDTEAQAAAMHKAIAGLSKIDKALVMLYLEDYPYQEIAEMLGITANNVAVKMNRIKIKLKEETQKYYQL
jgi:RNA polymerase sigma factor (sigma-70 family)